jgi:hypothetical protein
MALAKALSLMAKGACFGFGSGIWVGFGLDES